MRKFITTQAAQDGGYGWSILFAKRDKNAGKIRNQPGLSRFSFFRILEDDETDEITESNEKLQ